MPYSVKKHSNGKYCVFKEGDDTPMPNSCHMTKADALEQMAAMMADEDEGQKSAPLAYPANGETPPAKCAKCGEMVMAEPMYYVPYGITTIADALAAKEAKHEAMELRELVGVFNGVVENIVYSAETADKAAAIEHAAGELSAHLREHTKPANKPGDADHKSVDAPVLGPLPLPISATPADADALLTVKAIGESRIRAYAVLFGDATAPDLTRQWFDAGTEDLDAIYRAVGKLPVMYNHALDGSLKTRVIGVADRFEADAVGVWYEAELRRADEYDDYVRQLVRDGKLKTSTQTLASAYRVAKSGRIERWPVVEISLTPTPAEPRMVPVEALKSAYAEIGCEDFGCVLKQFGTADPTPVPDEKDGPAVKAALLIELEREWTALAEL